MVNLAVVNKSETFERIKDPLAERNIDIFHIPYEKQTLDIKSPDILPADIDVGYIYPGRIMEGKVIDTLLDVPWVNDQEDVLCSRNKAGVLTQLEQANIDVPRTVYVSNPIEEAEAIAAFEKLQPPIVIKPNSTTRGIGVTKAHDLDSFLGIIDYLNLIHDWRATGDRSYLIQEYIRNATDYRVMIIDGKYVGAVKRTFPSSTDSERWKHNVHRGATAVGVELPNRLRELAIEVAQVLDISILGVDLLVSNDRVVVNETNARPTIDEQTKYQAGFYDDLAGVIKATTHHSM
ncbi:MAG: RimK family alpha-L-glutamate ligase [Halobacteriaceae archaeon]